MNGKAIRGKIFLRTDVSWRFSLWKNQKTLKIPTNFWNRKGYMPQLQDDPFGLGSITIGLVNVPVKLYAMIYDKGIQFYFLHSVDGQPLKYVKMCTKDDKIVPWAEVIRGFEIAKNEYITLDKKN